MSKQSRIRPELSQYLIVRNGTGAKIIDGDTETAVTAASIKDFRIKIQENNRPVTIGIKGLSRAQFGRLLQGICAGDKKKISVISSQVDKNMEIVNVLLTPAQKMELPKGIGIWDSKKNGKHGEKIAMIGQAAEIR